MFIQTESAGLGSPIIITTIGTGTFTGTINIVIPFECKVCKSTGLVYGLDGKPYLCPKCNGDFGGVSQPNPIWIWNNSTTGAITFPTIMSGIVIS